MRNALNILQNIKLDKIKAFYVVAECGTVSLAAKRLDSSQPAISRQITALEESLGTLLFFRAQKGMVLTPQGEKLLETVRQVLISLAQAQNHIRTEKENIAGTLRIATMGSMSILWLPKIIGEFAKQHPSICLNITEWKETPNLSLGEADILIWEPIKKEKGLIHYPLTSFSHRLYASKDYLKEFGTPQKLQDIKKHRLIVQDGPEGDWILHIGATSSRKAHHPFITVDNYYALCQLTRQGYGIASLVPELCPIEDRAALVPVLPSCEEAIRKKDIHFITTKDLKDWKKVQLLLKFLQEESNKKTTL